MTYHRGVPLEDLVPQSRTDLSGKASSMTGEGEPILAGNAAGTDLPTVSSDATTSPSPQAAPRPARPSGRWLLGLGLAGGLVALGVWVTVTVITASHGFDYTDEGFYLLSYRWWRSNIRTFTGVQFFYGPLFQLVGWNIATLRLIRLLTVLVSGALFGWNLMRWLRLRRPHAPDTRLWELAGTVAITASGAMIYSWLPLSPGYNDISFLASFVVMAAVLALGADVDRGRRPRAWVAFGIGPLVVMLVLAKWASSVVTLALLAAVALVLLRRRGWREIARVGAWSLLGAAVAALAFHVLLVPLTRVLPQMLIVNKAVAAATNNPMSLLLMYARTTGQLLADLSVTHVLLLVVAVGLGLARRRVTRVVMGLLAVLAVALSGWRFASADAWHGGPDYLKSFPGGAVAVVLAVLLLGIGVIIGDRLHRTAEPSALSRLAGPDWAVFAGLVLLPMTASVGTGNALIKMAISGFAAWAAIVVAVVTGMDRASLPVRGLAGVLVAATVAIPVAVASTGLWFSPYRTAGMDSSTVRMTSVPALSSLSLSPKEATVLTGLHDRLKPYLEPPGRYVMAFDEKSGLVLALEGRTVGEAWYSRSDHRRTAAGIASQCHQGHGPWGARLPVLIFDRKVLYVDQRALRGCGLNLQTDYRTIPMNDLKASWTVYVPVREGGTS